MTRLKIVSGWKESYADSDIIRFTNSDYPNKVIMYTYSDKPYYWSQVKIDSITGRMLSGMVYSYRTMQAVINNLE